MWPLDNDVTLPFLRAGGLSFPPHIISEVRRLRLAWWRWLGRAHENIRESGLPLMAPSTSNLVKGRGSICICWCIEGRGKGIWLFPLSRHRRFRSVIIESPQTRRWRRYWRGDEAREDGRGGNLVGGGWGRLSCGAALLSWWLMECKPPGRSRGNGGSWAGWTEAAACWWWWQFVDGDVDCQGRLLSDLMVEWSPIEREAWEVSFSSR